MENYSLDELKLILNRETKMFFLFFIRESRTIYNDSTVEEYTKTIFKLHNIKEFVLKIFKQKPETETLCHYIEQSNSFTALVNNIESVDDDFDFANSFIDFYNSLKNSIYFPYFNYYIEYQIKQHNLLQIYELVK